MAIPVRDDGSPGPTKHLIVFVHGFLQQPGDVGQDAGGSEQ